MKIHIVNTSNICLYGSQLEEMHRRRKEVFVDKMGWSEIDTGHELEIDEFDNEHAHYMLLLDDLGNHLASCRLSPTDKPNVSCDKLARFFDNKPPRSPDVWEISRWLPSPDNPDIAEKCSLMMMMGLFEFGISRQLQRMIFCSGKFVTTAMAKVGVPIEKISKPVRFKEGVAFGVEFVPSAITLTQLRRYSGKFDSVTVELGSSERLQKQTTALQFAVIESVLNITNETALSGLLTGLHALQSQEFQPSSADIRAYFADATNGVTFQ